MPLISVIKKIIPTLLLLCTLSALSLFTYASETGKKIPYTYVIIHGATSGGWAWKGVTDALESNGHTAYRPTLTGLGKKVHLASPNINLTTHINDIVNFIEFEQLNNIVLVGHSYGGMVMTGVMNKIPERIAHAIFLEAAVPNDGMSAIDLSGPLPKSFKIENGLVLFPWVDQNKPFPRDVPHPLQTLTEPVSYNNAKAKKIPATYIAFLTPERLEERFKQDPSIRHAKERQWNIVTLDSDHNAHQSHPKQLADLLQSIPKL